eukprot:6467228-Amphidinium_carterae.1
MVTCLLQWGCLSCTFVAPLGGSFSLISVESMTFSLASVPLQHGYRLTSVDMAHMLPGSLQLLGSMKSEEQVHFNARSYRMTCFGNSVSNNLNVILEVTTISLEVPGRSGSGEREFYVGKRSLFLSKELCKFNGRCLHRHCEFFVKQLMEGEDGRFRLEAGQCHVIACNADAQCNPLDLPAPRVPQLLAC